jgi:cobalt-zinc-cadmium efflux system outer membrane protein
LNLKKVFPQTVFTLKEAVSEALRKNLELAAARKELDKAQGKFTQASLLSPFNPEIGSFVNNRDTEDGNETDRGINLSQTVEIFGQRKKRIAVARYNIQRVKREVENLERLIKGEVKRNFYQILYRQSLTQLRKMLRDLNYRLLKAVEERYQAGRATLLELNLARIEAARAEKDLVDALRRQKTAMLELKRLLSIPPEEKLEVKGKFSYFPLNPSLGDLLANALKDRPDLRAVKAEIERNRAEVTLLKAERLPNLKLEAFFEREEGTDDLIGGTFSFELPLFNRRQGEIEQARAVEAQALINMENTILTIKKEVEDAYQSFTAAKRGIEIFEEEVIDQLQQNLELNELSYEQGQIDLTSFLVNQNSLLTTQLSYLDSLNNYFQALVSLEKAAAIELLR